jgi:uncharacterized membrane protein SpoIIM required for sporulation
MSAVADDLARAQALLAKSQMASLVSQDDQALLAFLQEHRWAVARLCAQDTPLPLRTVLNAAVLRSHGLLHPRSTQPLVWPSTSWARVRRGLALSAGVFVASALHAFTAVLAEPVLALSLVPRAFLQQIDPGHWGERGSPWADLGMTLFYWTNNLRAAFLALGLGVLGGVPGLLVIAFNGVLLGAVAGAAWQRGAHLALLGWIAPHGVPEILGVLLCGAIGWELGQSFIRPGFRLRRAALAAAGRELMPMLLLAALLIICAAPLEGFVAPLDLPWWADAAFPAAWALLLTAAWLSLRREAGPRADRRGLTPP